MKAEEIKKMSQSDLMEELRNAKETLAKIKFTHSIAGTENPMVIRNKRRDIARMLTTLNQMKNNSNK